MSMYNKRGEKVILRKPYAVLIKYFKVIHLIIGLLSIFLTYKLTNMMVFLNNYMGSSEVLIQKGIADGLFSPLLYISIFIIIAAVISIIVLMAVKKKPIIQYIYTIVIQIAVIAMILFAYKNIKQLEISAVDIRTLKMCSDLLLITILLESTCIIAYLVRATGFNIKKFNFGEDLEELEITEKDNEEFEFSYEVDTNSIRRDIRKAIRDLKYLYGENKRLIHIVLIVSLVVLTGGGIYFYNKNHKYYSLGTPFYFQDYQVSIKDSYITKYDYRHEIIDDERTYVLLKVTANKNASNSIALNTTTMELTAGDHKFYPNVKERNFIDIGTTYTGQNLSKSPTEYLLIYELPKSFEKSSMFLTTYTTTGEYKTKIKPQRLDEKPKEHKYKLGDTLDFQGSVFEGIKLKLDSFDIKESFEVNYTYKLSDTEKFDSKEIVRPSYSGSADKSLLKCTGMLEVNDDAYLKGISLSDFITKYGKIIYEKDGKRFTMSLPMNSVSTKKVKLNKTSYIEVLKEVETADHVSLVFEIHSQTYNYTLK